MTTINRFFQLIVWIGVVGVAIYALGLLEVLIPATTLPLLAIIVWQLLLYIRQIWPTLKKFSTLQKCLTGLLIAQWFVYLVGVFVPETGFDALWYHLPQAMVYANSGKIAPVAGLLYNTLPRLGEMYFTLGFLTGSSITVKLVSFFFAILFALSAYHLARTLLSITHSLLVALIINSLYVVAWQASSGYVDLIRAVFEVTALITLVQWFQLSVKHKSQRFPKLLIWAAVFTGFALSVKPLAIISLLAGISLIVVSYIKNKYSIKTLILHAAYFILISIAIALPWYLENWAYKGHPLYPTNQPHLQTAALNHAGADTITNWIVHQVVRLPISPWLMTFNASGILTPMLLILLPILLWQIKPILKHQSPLLAYITVFFVAWWFIPPPESRYLLAAIPAFITLSFWALFHLPKDYASLKQWIIFFTFIGIAINLFARIVVSTKHLPVITGAQSTMEYINTNTNDFNREVVQKYYDYWPTFRLR